LTELPALKDDSFEVRWSLSELEGIVYEFINPHGLPSEFQQPLPGHKIIQQDVSCEDLMKVVHLKKGQDHDDLLPQMVREYILHDRGNSLFLGKSFGNLPSPVAESQTIKQLFKFSEDNKEMRQSKNQQIRVEGKDKVTVERKEPKDFKIDMRELNKFVFDDGVKHTAYTNPKVKLNLSYHEEESYENPQNVSRVANVV
jgi:hypothetical protein